MQFSRRIVGVPLAGIAEQERRHAIEVENQAPIVVAANEPESASFFSRSDGLKE